MPNIKKLSFQEQQKLALDENTPGEILTQLTFERVELNRLVAKRVFEKLFFIQFSS